MGHRTLTRALTTALSVGLLGVLGTVASGDQAKPRGQSGGSGSSRQRRAPAFAIWGLRLRRRRARGTPADRRGHSLRPRAAIRARAPAPATGAMATTATAATSPYYYAPGWGYWYNPGYYPGYYYGYSPYWGAGLRLRRRRLLGRLLLGRLLREPFLPLLLDSDAGALAPARRPRRHQGLRGRLLRGRGRRLRRPDAAPQPRSGPSRDPAEEGRLPHPSHQDLSGARTPR